MAQHLHSSTVVSDPPSNLFHTQERISQYRPGGYHPVCLGDTFRNGRYRVAHKLGWGGFSTVWLVEDTLREEWAALKVATADSTSTTREVSTLRSLHQLPGMSNYIPRLVDHFAHEGPNGVHQCLVTELLGPSIDTVVTDYDVGGERLAPEIILTITGQLLQAIDAIHKAGYGHGDISGANIVFTAGGLAQLTEEELFAIIGAPEVANLVRTDGEPLSSSLPKHLVQKVDWVDWIDEDEEDIRLLDWGGAFVHGGEPAKLAQPSDLRVPETFFVGNFDHRVDLWRAGCTIYSSIFAARPFQYLDSDAVLIAQMINFDEDLPAEWQTTWREIQHSSRSNYPTGTLRDFRLNRNFRNSVKEPELICLLPIIKGMMKFLPSERMSAAEALALL